MPKEPSARVSALPPASSRNAGPATQNGLSTAGANSDSNRRSAPNNAPQASAAKALPVNSRNAVATAASNPKSSTLRPAREFVNYVDYNLSNMSDTKGGFISAVDDPTNRTLVHSTEELERRPANMSLADWQRFKLLDRLRKAKSGPYAPGISLFDKDDPSAKKCRECSGLDIDQTWLASFGCAVCDKCKRESPDKYTLLTKTEVAEDYLLTDSELRDPDLLPWLERPNPHKKHWNSMLLFLRYQVEEYAFSPKKWGSPAALDAEFVRRTDEKKKRAQKKFTSQLEALKSRTRSEALRRDRQMEKSGSAAKHFGDRVEARTGQHTHEWEHAYDGDVVKKRCVLCNIEVEEIDML